jgi:hypothetical protein
MLPKQAFKSIKRKGMFYMLKTSIIFLMFLFGTLSLNADKQVFSQKNLEKK